MKNPKRSILDELWLGDIRPFEAKIYDTPEMNEVRERLTQCQESLEASMTEEQKHAFTQYENNWCELEALSLEALFTYAFRLGARIMMDVLRDEHPS